MVVYLSAPTQGPVGLRFYLGTTWEVLPGGVVNLSTAGSTVTSAGVTEVVGAGAGLTLSGLSLSTARYYRVEITGRASQSSVAQPVVVRVRASTGAVTTGSTQILGGQVATTGGPGVGSQDVTLSSPWNPASTGTWNLAVTVASGIAGTNGIWGPGVGNPIITLFAA
jgi:hypothetical protein